ncbi:MAG: acetyl-CoA C-acyltransferase [Candidatus Lokiarchaeota archaeon]|nr:acetyl-CoA C-acyltransferase [Candidatus Lokiarchaeota archaeon]
MKEAKEVYLVDHVRTPFSQANPLDPAADVFSEKQGLELAAHALLDMFDNRIPNKGSTLKREDVSEVLVGSALLQHEHGTFGGRIPIFMAKFPFHVPATVFDRQDGSGMTTLHVGFANISMGYSDVVVSVGFDQFTRVPLHTYDGKVTVFGIPPDKLMLDPDNKWYNDDLYDWKTSRLLFQSAQKLAEEEADHVTKEEMDKFGARSHSLAEKALESGYFKEEIMSLKGHEVGDTDAQIDIETDQSIKKAVTLENIASMPSISTPGWAGGYKNPVISKEEYLKKFGTEEGIITTGNSSPISNGASLCIIASKNALEEYNLKPISKVISIGFAGVDPTVRGRGVLPASQMALKHANLTVGDIDYFEINESFSVVALNAAKKLGIDWENKMNIHGGAIAIGNPASATGLRITTTLARILKEKKAKYGLAAMSCGGGQGTAVVIENLD